MAAGATGNEGFPLAEWGPMAAEPRRHDVRDPGCFPRLPPRPRSAMPQAEKRLCAIAAAEAWDWPKKRGRTTAEVGKTS